MRPRKYRLTHMFADDVRLLKIKAAEEGITMAEYLRRRLRGNTGGGDGRIW